MTDTEAQKLYTHHSPSGDWDELPDVAQQAYRIATRNIAHAPTCTICGHNADHHPAPGDLDATRALGHRFAATAKETP